MRDRWRVIVALLALGVGGVAESHAAVKPVVTNKSRFRIPFRFDAAMLQRMNARELQLFVSPSRGSAWELAQTINPQSGKFEFQAPADGEYWFAVRTIDGSGAAHPAGPKFDAGLIVVVDSIAPTLAINLEQTSPGKIQLTWSASDSNLDVTTLRLEYLQPGQTDWQQVSVVPTQRGATAWSVASAGRVSVRGSIADLAGNVGQTKSDIEATGGGPKAPSNIPSLREPIAEGPNPGQLSESPNQPMVIEPRTAQLPVPTPLSDAGPSLNVPKNAPGIPGPYEAQVPFVASSADQRPEITQDRWPAAAPAGEPSTFRLNGRQRVVNTHRFQLGYKVDDVGPSGVGGVDLFITPDNGRQWFRYGEDVDRTSPFEVQVPRDGDYGFTVRVRSGAGLGMDPPVPGEPPSIQVIVDQTPPKLELLPIRQGRGTDLNQITIQWKITEERPADKPVSLYYAPTPQGPWEPISGWRADTGSFAWSVGLGSPAQFWVRVVARDAAGNVSQAETTQPIMVDLARPTARIVDVEVLPATPR